MNYIHELKLMIANIDELGSVDSTQISFTRPASMDHGDYTTNIAMILAKQLGRNPVELAEFIVSEISRHNLVWIDTIVVAGPGFINITVTPAVILEGLATMAGEVYTPVGEVNHTGEHILIEHSSPNLFKPFHIGHLMNNTIGESLVRLAHTTGADVTCVSYPSDISLGIAKAVRIVLRDSLNRLHSMDSLTDKITYLGNCYVVGTLEFSESEEVERECREIAQKLYNKTDSPEYEAYLECKKINIEYFENIVHTLGSHFDSFIYESEAGVVGKEIVKKNIGTVFTESEGAVIFEGKEYGLHTRVFINSEGFPTYEAKDIGLLSLKFERFNPDLSILVTDHEQSNYYQVVKKAAGLINPDWEQKTLHKTHGRMSFQGQKMSSRLGNTPLAFDLLREVVTSVTERNPSMSQDDAHKVGLCALKFVILRSKAGSNINFDPETSLSLEGDSGPYLQYTVVRIRSLLTKAGYSHDDAIVNTPTEFELERILLHYSTVIDMAIREWAPHYIITYLLELAQSYNSWYGSTRIIVSENALMHYHLYLSDTVAKVITHGLSLLAIEVPEKM